MTYFRFVSMQGGLGMCCLAAFWVMMIAGFVTGIKNGLSKAKLFISVAWCFYSVVILTNALAYSWTLKATGSDLGDPRMFFANVGLIFHGHSYALAGTIIALASCFIHKESRKQVIACIPVFLSLALLLAACLLCDVKF
jgi:hypothetical protein